MPLAYDWPIIIVSNINNDSDITAVCNRDGLIATSDLSNPITQAYTKAYIQKIHIYQNIESLLPKLESAKLQQLPTASNFKVAQFLSSNTSPNFQNLGAFKFEQ